MSKITNKNALRIERINDHIASWSKSNQSITDYCRAQNIPKSTFYYWRKKSDPKLYPAKSDKHLSNSSFIEISNPVFHEKFCLHLPPYTLDIPDRFNTSTLCDIVSVLLDKRTSGNHSC